MPRSAPKHKPMHRLAPKHNPSSDAERYGQGRGGRPWRRLRDRVMERDGHLCQPCQRRGVLTLATECDHIVPVSKGGTDAETNLEAICGACHRAKSATEAARGRAHPNPK